MQTHLCAAEATTVHELHLSLGAPLSKALIADLQRTLDQAEDSGPCAAVVIHLDGLSPAGHGGDKLDVTLVNQWERVLRRFERLAAVTAVSASGDVGGLGLALLLCADYRVLGPDVRLRLAHPGQTLLPGMVLHRLSQQLGPQPARRMAVLDRPLSAANALAAELIDEVCDAPRSAALAFAEKLSGVDASERAVRRRLVLEATSVSYEDALGMHLAACDRALRKAAEREAAAQTPAAEASVA